MRATTTKSAYEPIVDDDQCYRAVQGRDRRFDGVFYTAVRTTGIYCRPSCPAVTPKRSQRRVLSRPRQRPRLTALAPASAVARPDARLARVGRAGRRRRSRDADDRRRRGRARGRDGLAPRAGYTTRHLNRVLTAQLGAGPLALARAHRAHTARILIETTDARLRRRRLRRWLCERAPVQRHDQRGVRRDARLSCAPRGAAPRCTSGATGSITVSLPVRQPFDAAGAA